MGISFHESCENRITYLCSLQLFASIITQTMHALIFLLFLIIGNIYILTRVLGFHDLLNFKLQHILIRKRLQPKIPMQTERKMVWLFLFCL